MQLYFLTAVGWSLDANGNLQALNTAGTLMAKFVSGFFGGSVNKATLASNGAITSIAAAGQVDIGKTLQITTNVSSTVLVIVNAFGGVSPVSSCYLGAVVKAGTLNPAGGTADASATTLQVNTTTTGNSDLSFAGLVTVTAGSAASIVLVANQTGANSFAWTLVGAWAMEL